MHDAGDGRAADSGGDTTGTLVDTYVAALQHGLVDLPPATTLVGVVRRPTPWFHAAVDENVPALGPPPDLLEETKAAEEDLKLAGLCEEEAHNAAWAEADFETRFREYLEAAEATAALETLRGRLESGESLALVCYENTERKRCHRTIVRERLESHR